MTERRTCLGCNREFSVTAAGVLRKHDKSTWLGGANYETKPCEEPGAFYDTYKQVAGPMLKALGSTRASNGPPGWVEAQRKAYAKIGLKWPPKGKALNG